MTMTDRDLRSKSKLNQANTHNSIASSTAAASMAPSKKRKAGATVVRYTCSTCDTAKASGQFPIYNPSPDCEHLINTCKNCLREWIEYCLENATFKVGTVSNEDGEAKEVWGIGCPECESVMRAVNVEMAVPKKVFSRYTELERKHIADSTPNWRWCLAPGCRAGQVHVPIVPATEPRDSPQAPEPLTKRLKRMRDSLGFKNATPSAPDPQDEVPDIMTCNTCSARSCTRCDRPMHDGETCSAYQARTRDRLEEEDKALQAVRKISRPCPGCSKAIEKSGGCSYMHCSQCRVNFCWQCAGLFDQNGRCSCRPGAPR